MRATAAHSSRAASIISSAKSRMSRRLPRVCTKTSKGWEAYFEQNNPHPDPLPSDGRGNSETCGSQLPKQLATPTEGARFNHAPLKENRQPPIEQTSDGVRQRGRNKYPSDTGIRRSCAAARGADIAARCPCHAKHAQESSRPLDHFTESSAGSPSF